MKKGNILVKAIAILVIILIILISFLGIHKRNLNKWDNVVPGFQFSKELSESRIYGFTVDDSTKEIPDPNAENSSEKTEAENNAETVLNEETTDNTEGEDDDETPTIEVPVNETSVLTRDNYNKSKKIIEARLKTFGITDTIVNVNEKTGAITVSAPYLESSNHAIDLITARGAIEIIDSETEEVLIGKDQIAKATAYYQPSTSTDDGEDDTTYYDLGIRLSFNSAGQNKLREISKKYIATTDEEGEEEQKTITVRLDGKDRFTTWFPSDQEFTELPMKLYQYVSPEDEDIWEADYNNCLIAQTVINSDTLPITYELTSGTFIESELNGSFIKNIAISGAVILAVVILITIIKYKKSGILISLIEIAYIAIHLLLIRVAGVSLSISGLLTIALMAATNYLLLILLMNETKVIEKIEAFGKFIITLIPFIITMIVFTLGKEINVQSIGMVGTWGILTFTCTLVASIILFSAQKEKKNGVEENEE